MSGDATLVLWPDADATEPAARPAEDVGWDDTDATEVAGPGPDSTEAVPAGGGPPGEDAKEVVGEVPATAAPAPPPRAAGAPPRRRSLLGGLAAELVAAGLLSERRGVALAFQARETGETLTRVIAREMPGGELEAVYEHLARRLGRPLIRRKAELMQLAAEVPWLPFAACEERSVLPLRSEDPAEAPYAALDPLDLLTRDWVARVSGRRPVPVAVLPDVLVETVGRLRARDERRDPGRPLVPIDISWDKERAIRERLESCDVPLIVDYIVHRAYEQDASDIHVEPVEDGTLIRARIDGMLHEQARLPPSLHPAIASRIKVLAGMDVAERRRPQDGRITAQVRRMPLDIRVSASPTVLGEKIVMRLLDERALRPAPEQLGLRDENLRLLLDKISAPHGLVMISGPTGSGKTTTLYSCLSAVDRQRRNVLTIEDPVEYRLKNVHQMQVNERIGVTFAVGLRNILRLDPDVIMVGECRDVETARTAIQASLTGHVVFSTIHANDAVGVVSRLLDMRLDPYSVANALKLSIAQRLLRSVCPECRVEVEGSEMSAMLRADGVSAEKLARLGIEVDPREPCLHAPGCPSCRHTGYAGRQAVYEMFEVTEAVRDLVNSERFSTDELRRILVEGGFVTMTEAALGLVAEGRTTLAEVVRVFGDGAG